MLKIVIFFSFALTVKTQGELKLTVRGAFQKKNCETHYRGEGLLFSYWFLKRSNMVLNIS